MFTGMLTPPKSKVLEEESYPTDPRLEDWAGVSWSRLLIRVPLSLVSIIARALAYYPEDWWPNARTFKRWLWRTRVIQYWLRAAALTAAGGGVVGTIVWLVMR